MSSENKNNAVEEDATTANQSSSDDEDPSHSFNMHQLQKFFAEKLNIKFDGDKTDKIKILDDFTLDGIVNYIKTKDCRNIITMAGAGISTSAGIPDFRSPGSGLYNNLEKYNLPYPQAIFEIDYFNNNPKPFFVLAKELYPGNFKPTLSHYFIKLLNEKGMLLRHYTQNIDALERVAKVPEEKLVEAHGTFYTAHCIKCRNEYQLDWMEKKIFNDEIPQCEKCHNTVKPDIVFFGENLPKRFGTLVDEDFGKCDLLIILGSSLVVEPFASLIDEVPSNIPRLLINREKVGHSHSLVSLLGGSSGLAYDKKDNTRDVAWLGDCDNGCQLLADKLGWGDELKSLYKKEHEEIDTGKNKDTANLASKQEEETD